MSYDSDISSYQTKINKRNNAKPYINKAITNYNDALTELVNIKNIAECETLKTNIGNKIEELNNLIKTINSEIETYKSKIADLEAAKAAEEAEKEDE